jgi:hypothetical protein
MRSEAIYRQENQTYLFVCVFGALVSGRPVCDLFRNVCEGAVRVRITG